MKGHENFQIIHSQVFLPHDDWFYSALNWKWILILVHIDESVENLWCFLKPCPVLFIRINWVLHIFWNVQLWCKSLFLLLNECSYHFSLLAAQRLSITRLYFVRSLGRERTEKKMKPICLWIGLSQSESTQWGYGSQVETLETCSNNRHIIFSTQHLMYKKLGMLLACQWIVFFNYYYLHPLSHTNFSLA